MKQKNNTNYEVLIVGIVAVVAIFAMIYPFMNFNYSGEDVAGKAYAMTDDGSVPERTSKSTTSKSLGTIEQGMVDAGFHCVVGDYDRLGNLKECYVSEEIVKGSGGSYTDCGGDAIGQCGGDGDCNKNCECRPAGGTKFCFPKSPQSTSTSSTK